MAKDEKLGKWVEAMTPRHAIENFFDHATLVDSPNPEELYKSSPVFRYIICSFSHIFRKYTCFLKICFRIQLSQKFQNPHL